MSKKIAWCMIGLALLFLSMNISAIFAQEPEATPEPQAPDTVVVAPEGSQVTTPSDNSGVTVVEMPSQESDPYTKITGILAIILSALVSFAALGSQYFSAKDLRKVLGAGEFVEESAWKIAATTSELVQLLGGRADVLVSSDPAELAKGLRNKEVSVFIKHDVDFAKVIEEYNKLA